MSLDTVAILRSELPRGKNGRMPISFPYIDDATLSVRWHGLACSLGATIPLRLLDRLCRRPNCFVSHEDLLQDVWHGARKSQNTVRSTVRRLKRSLEGAGMKGLAQCIQCEGGSYGLVLDHHH